MYLTAYYLFIISKEFRKFCVSQFNSDEGNNEPDHMYEIMGNRKRLDEYFTSAYGITERGILKKKSHLDIIMNCDLFMGAIFAAGATHNCLSSKESVETITLDNNCGHVPS